MLVVVCHVNVNMCNALHALSVQRQHVGVFYIGMGP